ncbi:MAG: proteasome assembly chaperone family protein, partial [Thermoprotei archaeon]
VKLKTRELMLQTRKTMSEMQKGYEMQLPLMYQ